MEISAKVDRQTHIRVYLQIWNGGLKLTDKELEIMQKFLTIYFEYKDGGVSEELIEDLVFSTKSINRLKEELKISKQNYSNYKMSIVEKKALREINGELSFNPMLIPQKSITFKFEINE